MNEESILPPPARGISALFDLGTPTGDMTRVTGGLTHRLWKLTTTRGAFAVKDVNRDPGNPNYVAWYERAFRFETAAWSAGIPAPRPVPVAATGLCLGELTGDGERLHTLRAHEWVDGAPLASSGYDDNLTYAIGSLLARVHLLGLPSDDSVPDRPRPRAESWSDFAVRLEAARVAWADELSECLTVIEELEQFAADARAQLASAPRIMGHRDVDQKNVLRTRDGGLVLVDWDASGPVNAREEFAKTAIDWIGWYAPEEPLARSYVCGYIDAGGPHTMPQPADFGEMADVILGWCEFNIRRTLGERLAGEAERAIAEHEARHVLSGLRRFLPSIPIWIGMLR